MITLSEFDDIKSKKQNLISDAYRGEQNQLLRNVDGKEIIQIEEKTQADRDMNEAINLWRMR